MFTITKRLSPHGAKLERWLGAEQVKRMSDGMAQWYGPPIAVGGVPGNVWAHKGGDFSGPLKAGQFMSSVDWAIMRFKRIAQLAGQSSRQQCGAGLTSLSDIIDNATNGNRREFFFSRVGSTGVAAATNSLWGVGNLPTAGAAGSAAPGGRATVDSTLGGFPFTNPSGGDTQHFVSAFASATTASNTLMLYDRLFDVAKTMSSTGTESVTGVPTRYQSSTATDADYAGGSFAFIEVFAALGAGAHNWTVCRYRNQAGTDTQSFPSMAGNASAIINRLDHPLSSWFMPLASGDTGVMDLDQMQCSASITGSINFVVGHPLAWMPCPLANCICVADGINTAFNLVRVFDDACLALLEVGKPSATATTYNGSFVTVSG